MELIKQINAVKWLKPVVELIQSKDFGEAAALVKWLPQQLESITLRCTAAIAIQDVNDCEVLLYQVLPHIKKIPATVRSLLTGNRDLLIQTAREAVDNSQPFTAYTCFLALGKNDPSAWDEKNLIGLVNTARLFNNLDYSQYGMELLNFFLQLDLQETQKYKIFDLFFSESQLAIRSIKTRGEITKGIEDYLVSDYVDISQDFFRGDKNIQGKLKPAFSPHETDPDAWIEKSEAVEDEKTNAATVNKIQFHTPDSFTQSRYTKIDFPNSCRLKTEALLKIQLLKYIPEVTRALEKISVNMKTDTKKATLDVHVTASGFKIHKDRQPMTIEAGKDSEELIFYLTPLESGFQAIEIEFWYRCDRVGYIIINTEVTVLGKAKTQTDIALMEPPLENLPLKSQRQSRKYSLKITWNKNQLSYTVSSDNTDGSHLGQIDTPALRDDIVNQLREINGILTEIVSVGSPSDSDWKDMLITLKGVGSYLFDELIPPNLHSMIRNWEPGSTVLVSTNENWVPWELMHDSGDFWGRKYIVARYQNLGNFQNQIISNRKSVPGPGNVRELDSVLNVVGGNISAEQTKKAVSLFENFPEFIPVTLLEKKNVSSFVDATQHSNCLHFTCHGYQQPAMLQVADNKSRFKNLLITTVKALHLKPGSLVFVNACSSSAPVITFGRFNTFGWEFYKRGCDLYIGALGKIPEKYAVTFAESVYRELLLSESGENITIGQAIARAKKEAEGSRNLFWLLYTLYGDPDICIKLKNK